MEVQAVKPIIGVPCAYLDPVDALGRRSVGIPRNYIDALETAGGIPLLIPTTKLESTRQLLYRLIDGLFLSGGPDLGPAYAGELYHSRMGTTDPERDETEITMTKWALSDKRPILGVCRGIQTLNVACGGTLWHDIRSQIPDALEHQFYPGYPFDRVSHSVNLASDSQLANLFGVLDLSVNSLHHQAVKEVGEGLRVTARAPDGVIEGIESTSLGWVVAVQWHPEALLSKEPRMRLLFETFVRTCAKRQAEHG
jgi:putative glutamine amidotransferase